MTPAPRPCARGPTRRRSPRARKPRGALTLLLCALLLFGLSLAALWTSRQLAAAQRIALRDRQLAAAETAAQAGLAWAVTLLNAGRVDADCRAAFAPQRSLRQRLLVEDPLAGATPRSPPSRPAPGCVNVGPQQWRCRCDPDGSTAMPAATAGGEDEDRPSFSIRLTDAGTDTGTPRLWRLTARGCSDARAGCGAPGDIDLGDEDRVVAEQGWHLALLSALRRPPAQALTLGPDAFDRVFALPPALYRVQPALSRLTCSTAGCDAGLRAALSRGRRLLWIDGDATLDAAALAQALGATAPSPASPDPAPDEEPLLLLVDGRLELTGAAELPALIYARDGLRWAPPPGQAASLRGALVSDIPPALGDTVLLRHDPALLARLHQRAGSRVVVPGSWRPGT